MSHACVSMLRAFPGLTCSRKREAWHPSFLCRVSETHIAAIKSQTVKTFGFALKTRPRFLGTR